MQGRRAGSEEIARELFCEEFPVALHLYWRRSSKREFIRASAEGSVQSWVFLLVLQVQVYLNSFAVMQSRLVKRSIYATGRILLVSPPL